MRWLGGWVWGAVLWASCAFGTGARAGELPLSIDRDDEALDVLTLNTWGLPFPIASIGRRARFPAIRDYLRSADVDVAGLEEVWRGALRLLPISGMTVARDGGDMGLAIVSPYPVDHVEGYRYLESRGFDVLKSKGVLRARVEVPGAGDLWVFVTHMQAGAGLENARVRLAQVGELLERIAATDGPALLLGDFNLHRGDFLDGEALALLERAGLIDVATVLGNDDPTYLDEESPRHRYDRVFVRDSASLSMVPEAAEVVGYDEDPETANPPPLSDHQPVRVRLAVRHPARSINGEQPEP